MTISKVQHKHTYVGTTAAFSSNVTAGNLIIVWVSGSDGTSSDASCSDNLGNTYTKVGQVRENRTSAAAYYAIVTTGGSCTVTAQAGAGDHGLTAYEYTSTVGSFTSGEYVSGEVVGVPSGTTLTRSATLSSTGMLFSGWANELNNFLSGWTSNLTQIARDTGHYDASAHGLNLSSGSYTEGPTTSSASLDHVVTLLAFHEPSSGGSAPLKNIVGLPLSSTSTVLGLAKTSVKTFNGLSTT